jgi:hypothetical protein
MAFLQLLLVARHPLMEHRFATEEIIQRGWVLTIAMDACQTTKSGLLPISRGASVVVEMRPVT